MLLPSCLPNETLHSRICRYLAISGIDAQDFLNFVFKYRRYSVHPFLNADLNNISKYTTELAIDIWQFQTLSPLFAYYLPMERHKIKDLRLTNEKLIRNSQISIFKEREGQIIKHCPYCASEDIKNYGVAYWHLEHQITGVDACYLHNIWLLRQFLPERIRINAKLLPQTLLNNTNHCSEKACQFARFVSNKLKEIQENKLADFNHFDLLERKGFAISKNRVGRIKLYEQLNIFSKDVFIPNSPLFFSNHKDFNYWSKVIRARANQPPFKHMLLKFFLEQLPDKIQCTEYITTSEDKEKIRSQCISLLEDGVSFSDIRKQTGKSLCYIKMLAQKEKIKFEYNPTLLTEVIRQSAIKMAKKGFHRKVIASNLKVSVGIIENIISTTDGLVAWRKKCRYESKRRKHKLALIRYIQFNPNALRKDIKCACNSAFFWFYLNEKKWLESFLPKARAFYSNIKPKVDWAKRDRLLADEVKIILARLVLPTTRTEMGKMFGNSRLFTSYKHKLPLTMGVLAKSKLIKLI